MPTIEPDSGVTIFEAINHARKELFVGATALPMHALIAALRSAPPRELAAWRPDDVEYRSLEFGVDAAAAAERIKRIAPAPGWRLITAGRIIGS